MSTAFPFMSLPRELRDRVYTLLLILPTTGVSIAVIPNKKTIPLASADASAHPQLIPCVTTLCKAIYTFDPSLPAPHTAIFLTNRQVNFEAWQAVAREGVVHASKSGRIPLRLSYFDTPRVGMDVIAQEILEDRKPMTEVTDKVSGRTISLYASKEPSRATSNEAGKEPPETDLSRLFATFSHEHRGR